MSLPRTALLLGASLTLANAAFAESFPKRKAGLWEMTMMREGAPVAMGSMKMRQCVDEKSDEALQRKALSGDGKADCTHALKKVGGGFEIDATCTGAEGKMQVHAKMTGDLQSSYTVENTITFTPPRHGLGTSQMTLKATYAGPCPADLKPGEARVGDAGGPTINPSQPGGGFDLEKVKNMTPEQRQKWLEQMKKTAEEMQKSQGQQ